MATKDAKKSDKATFAEVISVPAREATKPPLPLPAPTTRILKKSESRSTVKTEPAASVESAKVETLRLEVARLRALASVPPAAPAGPVAMEVEPAATQPPAERALASPSREAAPPSRAVSRPSESRRSPRPTHRGNRGGRDRQE